MVAELARVGGVCNVTLTDATLAEIEARATSAHITATRERYQGHPRWIVEVASVDESIQTSTDSSTLGAALDEYRWMCRRMPALVAALRASRERERRVRLLANTWESQADDYPAEVVAQYAAVAVRLCARELRAALGEEAPNVA